VRGRDRFAKATLSAAALFAAPISAPAHMAVPGSNALGNGIMHPLSTPAHLLVLLALGLLLGQRVPLRVGPVVKVFAPVAAVALLLTMTGRIPTLPQPLFIAIALVAATAVALAARLPAPALAALLAIAAIAIGLDSTVEGASAGFTLVSLAGTWACLVVLLLNLAYYLSLAAEKRVKWIDIALRVAGSWIIAISLLVLAFALRPH
jgi:hydrogenase/urease accessory protein HupE